MNRNDRSIGADAVKLMESQFFKFLWLNQSSQNCGSEAHADFGLDSQG
jgi:hypothetical protein